ncbi:MAG: methanol dehydrogenase [Oscillatoriales cyanobacterium SM2_2_1]|nr:methanol dehydrogenase [Oscillatoriales cyanobacterium SM2_2_1]
MFSSLGSPAWAVEAPDFPPLPELAAQLGQTAVLDDAAVLSASTEKEAIARLTEVATQTGIQAHLLTVKRIDFGQPVEEFTKELFFQWFPSPEEQSQQILVVVASEDHRTAIHMGSDVALEPAIAQSITQETMLLPIQKANYNQGVRDGIERLSLVLTGAPDPGPPAIAEESGITRNYATAEETDVSQSSIVVVVLLVVATIIPMVTYFWLNRA